MHEQLGSPPLPRSPSGPSLATLDVPTRYLAAAAPIIVTSPTTRCGTTLVQRLLCASDNAFVYGEEIGAEFRALAALLSQQIHQFEQKQAALDDAFHLALAGALRDWRPGLTPPTAVLLKAWIDVFYQLPLALADYGQTIERPIWGFKWPGCPPDTLRTFQTLMPGARVVYVVRNIVDTLKSAKARRFVKSPPEAAAYCAEWARNLRGVASLPADRLLVIRYEALMQERDAHLAALARFTGALHIRRSEFDIKVNTFEGDEADGHSPTQYIAPEPLTEADWAALRAEAGEAMAELYPEMALA
jgi:hypothetical protein